MFSFDIILLHLLKYYRLILTNDDRFSDQNDYFFEFSYLLRMFMQEKTNNLFGPSKSFICHVLLVIIITFKY